MFAGGVKAAPVPRGQGKTEAPPGLPPRDIRPTVWAPGWDQDEETLFLGGLYHPLLAKMQDTPGEREK